jgi:hypothetical protein
VLKIEYKLLLNSTDFEISIYFDHLDIIVQIHKLIEYIEFGKVNNAPRQASELASKGIKFKLNTLNARADTDDDEEIT